MREFYGGLPLLNGEVQVCGQTFCTETIRRIQESIDQDAVLSRSRLSRQVCQSLDWRTKKGKVKQVSCRVALLKLERKPVIPLPPAREFARANKRTNAPKATRISDNPYNRKLYNLQPIQLILIRCAVSRAYQQWNELMSRHHYLSRPVVRRAASIFSPQSSLSVFRSAGFFSGHLAAGSTRSVDRVE